MRGYDSWLTRKKYEQDEADYKYECLAEMIEETLQDDGYSLEDIEILSELGVISDIIDTAWTDFEGDIMFDYDSVDIQGVLDDYKSSNFE